MAEFFDMGGYGGYVWPAYAVSAAAIGGLAFIIWKRSRRMRRKLKEADRRTDDGEAA
jgi:heme exporter protein CcmD